MNEQQDPSTADKKHALTRIKVWDLPVRIAHWSILVLFIAAYITNALGPNYFIYHLWAGYAMLVIVAFRLVWGLVGTYHARFINFICNPITTAKYALSLFKNNDKHYTGHNPLGAIMVVILLAGLFTQAVTGLFANDEIFNVGPLYTYISDDLSLSLTALHSQVYYWILGAVVLHIAAVLFHVFAKHDNIIKAMFTGKKSVPITKTEITISSSRLWLAITLLVVLSLILAWVIMNAPEAVSDV